MESLKNQHSKLLLELFQLEHKEFNENEWEQYQRNYAIEKCYFLSLTLQEPASNKQSMRLTVNPKLNIARKERGIKGYNLHQTKLKIQQKPLTSVLPKAQKVVTYKDWKAAQDQVKFLNVIDQIDHLKQDSMWSLKQIKPQVMPPREKCQWDYMLEEMEWLAVDFREERKWKICTAYNLAKWCMEWHLAPDKSKVCVRTKPHVEKVVNKDENMDQDTVNNEDIAEIPVPEEKEEVKATKTVVWKTPAPTQATVDPSDVFKAPQPVQPDPIKEREPAPSAITIDLVSNLYFIPSSINQAQALSGIPTYHAPKLTTELYTESDSISKISQIMLTDYFESFNTLDQDVKVLSGMNKYSKSLPKSNIFDNSETEPIKQPKSAKYEKTSGVWIAEEEESLFNLAEAYNQNWELIASTLNGSRIGNSKKRTDWCCYEKYKEMVANNYKPTTKQDYLYYATQNNKKDKKVKVLGLLSTFNFITNLSKKRESNKQANNKKQVNLTAHETHKQTQIAAGIDLNAPPLRPIELSKIKENRDKILEQNRQAGMFPAHKFGAPVRPMGVPFRPMGMVRPATPQGGLSVGMAGMGVGVQAGLQTGLQQPVQTQVMQAQMPMNMSNIPMQGQMAQMPMQVPVNMAQNMPQAMQGMQGVSQMTNMGMQPVMQNGMQAGMLPQQQMQIPANFQGAMQFRPQMQTSPQKQQMMMNYSQEQIQSMMLAQQRYLAARGMDQNSLFMRQRPPQQRQQLQTDLSTAAAYVALQNAQNAAKMNPARPIRPITMKVEEKEAPPPKKIKVQKEKTKKVAKKKKEESEEDELEEEDELVDELSSQSSPEVIKKRARRGSRTKKDS
ncbi:chromatin modification- protein VID21 [Boothiomyces sp. JEL0838]|nr:chromatin modification- protein VID21 [Boothiomyces sp. JEL0838]KAJ3309752.1 chromatin modification- protein VID21 [Boothiomyces sp. JEL0838]